MQLQLRLRLTWLWLWRRALEAAGWAPLQLLSVQRSSRWPTRGRGSLLLLLPVRPLGLLLPALPVEAQEEEEEEEQEGQEQA